MLINPSMCYAVRLLTGPDLRCCLELSLRAGLDVKHDWSQ